MKEVEILVEVKENKKDVLKKLNKYNFAGKKEVLDIYFYDKKRDALKPRGNRLIECFRLRKKDKTNYITYKIDKFDESNNWLYSEEEETEIKDFDVAFKIISNLGLVPLVEIDNVKHTYYTKKYEIVLEEVKNLGLFLEVERLKVEDEENIMEVKKEIFSFINSLNIKIGNELNSGKPELMLNKIKY
jgi:adenylate cyclase class 2